MTQDRGHFNDPKIADGWIKKREEELGCRRPDEAGPRAG
jgi:hypothetical protein